MCVFLLKKRAKVQNNFDMCKNCCNFASEKCLFARSDEEIFAKYTDHIANHGGGVGLRVGDFHLHVGHVHSLCSCQR